MKQRLHDRIAVKIAEQENDREDATEDLEEITKFLSELEVNCELTEFAEYGNMFQGSSC